MRRLVLAGAATLALAACAPGATDGFAPPAAMSATVAQADTGVRRPLLRIGTIRGPSNAARRGIRDAITASLKRRGIDVVRRGGPNVLELSGSVSVLGEAKVTTYTHEWRLTDGNGRLRARPIVGFERTAGGSGGWGEVSGSALLRMGERVARRIALALGRPG